MTSPWTEESARLESLEFPDEFARSRAIVEWAVERFGDGLILTSSFQDAVMAHLVSSVNPGIEIVFLDTQYHFRETIAYRDRVTNVLRLNVRTVQPKVAKGEQYRDEVGVEACCNARKVQPLDELLKDKSAWLSGIRRVETPERASTPIVDWSSKASHSIVKISPIARWTDDDVERYQQENNLPLHPLSFVDEQAGTVYASIGCEPCTQPIPIGADARSGRWAGAKTECGLHLECTAQ